MCGATVYALRDQFDDVGLSPRVRGNRARTLSSILPLGPIPACAGQPCKYRYFYSEHRAYPRVCGATAADDDLRACSWGLSPRVRGNLLALDALALSEGPIPACAGQPSSARQPKRANWAYPRVCGATRWLFKRRTCCSGLSPRVRGNLGPGEIASSQAGPIPACAGQPFSVCLARSASTAYPRVCGATVDEEFS